MLWDRGLAVPVCSSAVGPSLPVGELGTGLGGRDEHGAPSPWSMSGPLSTPAWAAGVSLSLRGYTMYLLAGCHPVDGGMKADIYIVTSESHKAGPH